MLRPLAGALVLALALTACDAVGPVNEPPPEPPSTPADLGLVLERAGRLETFAALAEEARLATLGDGPVTVLAPDDEAFALMSPESVEGLRRQSGALDQVLRRHVVTAAVDLAALSDGDALPTLEGTPLPVRIDDEGTVFLGGVRVVEPLGATPRGPVLRLAGVVRDHLTARQRIAASPLLTRSLALLEGAGVDLTRPGTYFVPIDVGYRTAPGGVAAYADPSNAALIRRTFRALAVDGEALSIADLRTREAVETAAGSTLRIDATDGFTRLGDGEGRVVAGDIAARGARIHLIDRPLQGHLTLMERIDFLPETEVFAGLVRAAGLDARLSGAGPLTVFAPTTAAVDSIGPRGRSALQSESALRSLLVRFHVSPVDVPSSAFVNGTDVPSLLDGTPIPVRPNADTGASTAIGRASPTTFVDLPALNGRLHLMRSFLNPPTLSVYDQLVLSGGGAFREAAALAGRRGLLEGAAPVTVIVPATVSEQFFNPLFGCRVQELVDDHIATRPYGVVPLMEPFETLGGAQVRYQGGPPAAFQLRKEESGQPQTLGRATLQSINFRTSNGSLIHTVDGRLRWYASAGPAMNLPACSS